MGFNVISLIGLCLLLGPSWTTSEQIFKWKTIQFNNLPRAETALVDGVNVYYNERNILTSSAAYDDQTKHVCWAFPRINPGIPVTVGCFNYTAYNKLDSPKFTAFPTVADNDLPVRIV